MKFYSSSVISDFSKLLLVRKLWVCFLLFLIKMNCKWIIHKRFYRQVCTNIFLGEYEVVPSTTVMYIKLAMGTKPLNLTSVKHANIKLLEVELVHEIIIRKYNIYIVHQLPPTTEIEKWGFFFWEVVATFTITIQFLQYCLISFFLSL